MSGDIAQWLQELGLGQHAQAFIENGIGLDILPDLSEDDLKDLGLNLGDRRRLQRAIQSLSPIPTQASIGETAPTISDDRPSVETAWDNAERP